MYQKSFVSKIIRCMNKAMKTGMLATWHEHEFYRY